MRLALSIAVSLCLAAPAWGAAYYGTPADAPLPGETVRIDVSVETEADDNLVGAGHFAFALDLTLGGTAGVAGDSVGNVVIDAGVWDDVGSSFLGGPAGDTYTGIGGATLDAVPPNFGADICEIVPMFSFDLLIPPSAEIGQTVDITFSEGTLLNVTADLVQVTPQNYAPLHFEVVPEPNSLFVLLAGVVLTCRRPRRL